MIRIEFIRPIKIEQEGMEQLLTYIDCEHLNSINDFTMMIYVTKSLFFTVSRKNIKHISAA